MTFTDWQLTAAKESVYGTAVSRTRAWEYESESIAETEGRTESNPMRLGTAFARSDRFTPYFAGAGGDLEMTVMTKGFGFWLEHMLGTVATTGPAETTAYTHTGTEGSLVGKSLCLQVNRPFSPSGTNQPFTFTGGKVTDWSLSNSVDDTLVAKLGLDFMQVSTAIGLDTPAYPSGMDPLTWAGGLVQIAGTSFDVTEFAIEVDSGMDTGRRQIRRNTDKKEPISTQRSATFTIKADFIDLAQRARVHAATRSAALATLSAGWQGPTLLGTTIFPSLTVSATAARFDKWTFDGAPDALTQTLSGVITWDGSASPITLAYVTGDTTP